MATWSQPAIINDVDAYSLTTIMSIVRKLIWVFYFPGCFRIENRIPNMKINIRQSTLGDDAWVTIHPLSSINFAWEVPYGPNLIDICLQNGNNISFQNISLENATGSYAGLRKEGFDFHITESGDKRNVRIIDIKKDLTELLDKQPTNESISNGDGPSLVEKMKTTAPPVEFIIELGVVGISLVDHRPRELLYLSLEKVFVSYSSGYDGGSTSRYTFYRFNRFVLYFIKMDI